MNKSELDNIVELHGKWLQSQDGGELANLTRTNLSGADLTGAYLTGANLAWANLAWANLAGANLSGANLTRVDVSETVLDPNRPANGDVDGFERDGDDVIGYRTREAGHIGIYRDGWTYSADWFSTCPETECHPGLYLWPTLAQSMEWESRGDHIRVTAPAAHVHHVGGKWRCRWFTVLGRAGE